MNHDKLNLDTLTSLFADEDKAIEFVESLLWPDGPVCPHCGVLNGAYKLTSHSKGNGKRSIRRGLWKCGGCRKQFTVRVGTVFEESKLPLRKWLMAIHMMCCAKKGVSSHQIARQVGCTQKTAWFLNHRIREAMKLEPMASLLGGSGQSVEADECYIGGKPRPGSGQKSKRGRGTAKTPVAVLVERDGRAHARVVENVDAAELKGAIRQLVDSQSKIVTDDFASYHGIGDEFAGGHSVVNHTAKQYVNQDGEHTNTAESFIALIKRGHYGIFHKLSKKHLGRYVNEFSFRWDHRKTSDGSRMVEAIKGAEGKRLMYREPIVQE